MQTVEYVQSGGMQYMWLSPFHWDNRWSDNKVY